MIPFDIVSFSEGRLERVIAADITEITLTNSCERRSILALKSILSRANGWDRFYYYWLFPWMECIGSPNGLGWKGP